MIAASETPAAVIVDFITVPPLGTHPGHVVLVAQASAVAATVTPAHAGSSSHRAEKLPSPQASSEAVLGKAFLIALPHTFDNVSTDIY